MRASIDDVEIITTQQHSVWFLKTLDDGRDSAIYVNHAALSGFRHIAGTVRGSRDTSWTRESSRSNFDFCTQDGQHPALTAFGHNQRPVRRHRDAIKFVETLGMFDHLVSRWMV